MKRFTAVCTVLLLLATFTAFPAQAVNIGYWVLESSALDASEPGSGADRSVKTTLSQNSAEFITTGTNNEYEKGATSWSAPERQLKADGLVELTLTSSIAESVNCVSPQVTVCAFIGEPDSGVTAAPGGSGYLIGKENKSVCMTTLPGTTSMTVSASLGAGGVGDKKAVYVMSYNNGQIAQCQYVYQWTLLGETASVTESATAANGTTAVQADASSVPLTSAKSDGGSVAFSNFDGSALRSAVVVGALLVAAILLILIRRRQKANQGLTVRPLNAKNMKKFSRLWKNKSDEDDFDDGTLSVRCPSCQAPIKKSTRICPHCRRPVK